MPLRAAFGTRCSVVVLLVAVILLYGRSLGFGFVRADDTDLIEGNAEFLSSLSNAPQAFTRSFFESGAVLTDVKTYYRPLTVVSFMIDAAVDGPNPAMYHVTNVLLHAAVVALLFVMLRGTGTAFLASLLFAVHPANVHTVSWIMGRNELLLAAFSLIAFASFTRVNASRMALVIHVLAFAGAVFSKETGVVLLPLLLVLWVTWDQSLDWFRRRSLKTKLKLGPTSIDSRPVVALAVDVGILLVWWGLRGVALSGGISSETFSLSTIVANAPQLFVYLEKIVFPVRLNPMPGVDRLSILLGAVAATLLIWLLTRVHEGRTRVFIAAWFLAFLVPALLVPGLPAYEHRLYVPLIGVTLAFGSWGQGPGARGRERQSRQRRVDTLALAIAAAFFVVSFRYTETFRSPLTYWSRATEGTPYAPIAHVNVGQILQEIERPQDAASHFRRALELDPGTPKAHNNLGVALIHLGRRREAFEAFSDEVRLHPWNADAHYNLGLMYEEEGRLQDAIARWEDTLSRNKYYIPAYEKLRQAYAARGEHEKAAAYERQLQALRRR